MSRLYTAQADDAHGAATRAETWVPAQTLAAVARYADDLDFALMWGTNHPRLHGAINRRQRRADRIAFRRKVAAATHNLQRALDHIERRAA